jgi:hypothetical protein
MGLDLIVEGCAKPGHEDEWRRLLQRSFLEEELATTEVARFQEISTPGYERIGAPRVGEDESANEWLLRTHSTKTPDEKAAVLRRFEGHYAIALVDCDGVPKYSSGGLYDGADETSFRGTLLNNCRDVLNKDLLNEAWKHKFPEEAVSYGRRLLAAADTADREQKVTTVPADRQTLLSRLGLRKKAAPSAPLQEQVDIVRTAGRWYVFWGERGHAIRAWF